MPSRFSIHRVAAAVVTILTVAFPVTPASAVDPPSITGLTSRSSLSADDRGKIEEYAKAYTAKLLVDPEDAGESRRVRSKLVDVIRRGGTSEVFRDTYCRYALPGLEKVIAEGSADQAVTALVVVSQLGTEQALAALVNRTRLDDEPRRHVRLSAARGVAQLLAAGKGTVGAAKIGAAARSLAEATEKETDPHTLRHLIQAILAASEATDDATSRDQMHTFLVQAIGRAAERAARADAREAADLLNAIYPVLHRLRTRYIVMDLPLQKNLGGDLGPCVQKVLSVATAHWAEFQRAATSDNVRQPANIIFVSERFLSTIDRVMRGDRARLPDEKLVAAWDANDESGFKAILGQWDAVLSRSPY